MRKRFGIMMIACLLSLATPLAAPAQANVSPPQLVAVEPVAITSEMLASDEAQDFHVKLRIAVSEEGSVRDVQIVESSGNGAIDQAVAAAAQNWTFQPARQNGKAVASVVVVPINFRAEQDAAVQEDGQP